MCAVPVSWHRRTSPPPPLLRTSANLNRQPRDPVLIDFDQERAAGTKKMRAMQALLELQISTSPSGVVHAGEDTLRSRVCDDAQRWSQNF